MAKKAKGAKNGVIDVDVVSDSEDEVHGRRPVKLGIGTVARPALIGALVLAAIGTVLPH
jgi:hypothetical protein